MLCRSSSSENVAIPILSLSSVLCADHPRPATAIKAMIVNIISKFLSRKQMTNSISDQVLAGAGPHEVALPKWRLQRASWSEGHTVRLVGGRWVAVPTDQSEAKKLDRLIPFVRVDV